MSNNTEQSQKNTKIGAAKKTYLGFRIAFSLFIFLALGVFSYWYAVVPYDPKQDVRSLSTDKTARAVPEEQTRSEKNTLRYPTLDTPQKAASDDSSPDSTDSQDPTPIISTEGNKDGQVGKQKKEIDLFHFLPGDSLVYAYLQLEKLKKIGWLRPILEGKQSPWIEETASSFGVSLTKTKRLAVAMDVRSSLNIGVHKLSGALRSWKKSLKRPLSISAETKCGRQEALGLFRKSGSLTATIILGHRVYQKDPGFFMTLPGEGLLLSTYRRPMTNLLGLLVGRTNASAASTESITLIKKMLEDAPHEPIFGIVSHPKNLKKSNLRVPGGGIIQVAGLTVSRKGSDLWLRWLIQLDTPRNAERFSKRARRLLEGFRKQYWTRKTGLHRAIQDIVFTTTEAEVVTELELKSTVCREMLKHFTGQ